LLTAHHLFLLRAFALLELLAEVLRPLGAALVRLGVLLGIRFASAPRLLLRTPRLLGAQVLGLAVQVSANSSR
jgi:hypothetical protein